MSTYPVTMVRKEPGNDGQHLHIAGVRTAAGVHYSRREVIDSISAGHSWHTTAEGFSALIRVVGRSFTPGCLVSPYLATNPDGSGPDNLENLPEY